MRFSIVTLLNTTENPVSILIVEVIELHQIGTLDIILLIIQIVQIYLFAISDCVFKQFFGLFIDEFTDIHCAALSYNLLKLKLVLLCLV